MVDGEEPHCVAYLRKLQGQSYRSRSGSRRERGSLIQLVVSCKQLLADMLLAGNLVGLVGQKWACGKLGKGKLLHTARVSHEKSLVFSSRLSGGPHEY